MEPFHPEAISLRNPEQLEHLVLQLGFLPFFHNGVEGFSIEEMTPREYWFSQEVDGPWEWKTPVICGGLCAYGKFFDKKAGYVSLEWFSDFMNWRRWNNSLTPTEMQMLQVVRDHESLLTHDLKKACGYISPSRSRLEKMAERKLHGEFRREAYETAISHLQMSTHCCIAGFEYKADRRGKPYGWGIARYTTPEVLYEDSLQPVSRSPKESYSRMLHHLSQLFPKSSEPHLRRLLD